MMYIISPFHISSPFPSFHSTENIQHTSRIRTPPENTSSNITMEFQEAVVRMSPKNNLDAARFFGIGSLPSSSPKSALKQNDKSKSSHSWKMFFNKSSTTTSSVSSKSHTHQEESIPKEFLCPISGCLMSDPVIVSSGHTFERSCVEGCKSIGFSPTLDNQIKPDFSAIFPNLALKSAILNYCKEHSISPPRPLDFSSALKDVKKLIATQESEASGGRKTVVSEDKLIRNIETGSSLTFHRAVDSDSTRPSTESCSSTECSIENSSESAQPSQLMTRPSQSSCSSSSSTEMVEQEPTIHEEESFLGKIKTHQVDEIEEAVVSLRKITRTREDIRASLCTPRLLSALRLLISSRWCNNIQVNALAALVNLSLEKANKTKIVRSGLVLNIIDALKRESNDVQEHASAALYSLALEDDNKSAIGVLGALSPLIYALRSSSNRVQVDSAMALYHLTRVHSNRTKAAKLGLIRVLLNLGGSNQNQLVGPIVLILCNLGLCPEGRTTMLDSGVVEYLVGLLSRAKCRSASIQNNCLTALVGLSHGGPRFRALAKASGAIEVLARLEDHRLKPKASWLVEVIEGRTEEDEETDWEALLELGLPSQKFSSGIDESSS